MVQGSKRVLVPTFLVVFAGLLLGLLFASPAPTSRAASLVPLPLPAAAPEAPWDPIARQGAELHQVESILEGGTVAKRLDALAAIYDDATRPAALRGLASFAAASLLSQNRRGAEAVARYQAPEIASTELSAYALFLASRELESIRPDEALDALEDLVSHHEDFILLGQARLDAAALLRARGLRDEAIEMLQPAAESGDPSVRGEALDDLGSLLADAKRYEQAVLALETLYYELPRHPRASGAGRSLNLLRAKLPAANPLRLYTLGFHRAELLMGEERYSEAYETLAALLTRYSKVGDEERVRLEMGVAQYERRQFAAAALSLKKVRRDDLAPQAMFYLAESARRLRQKAVYFARVGEIVDRYPKSPWSEEALIDLARYHLDQDEKSVAIESYRRAIELFPSGKYFLEAKWHVLWDLYRSGNAADAAFGWEEAARERPGDDDVPRFLYWAGHAYQDAGRSDRAEPIYRQVLLGYQNTYYGRRAFEHLSQIEGQGASLAALQAARDGIDLSDALVVERVGLQRRIAELYSVGLEKEALLEIAHAVCGKRDDAAFLAMAAWIHADRNRNLDAFRTLRDAFPFQGSATGDLLPRSIWELLYPLHYWESVVRYSTERGLDPYLVAALIRQESTFNPKVRSRAGARGLMQILPSTGRVLARQERQRYDASDLYKPEINIRYGTRYLKDILDSFDGRVDYALASYNAGPHRVKRWTGMDMTIPSEIFIEEIPFDETRDYVKLVLRNEMLYRRLYREAESKAAAGGDGAE
jgi:peptidoglycan lytic transglycosylase